MTWTLKKDFDGITAINKKQTGAVQIREKDDARFAIVSSKYDAFKMDAIDMFQLGYLLIEMSDVCDKDVIDSLQTAVDKVVAQKKSPLVSRNVELPKRDDGCIALEGANSISKYIRSKETGVAFEPSEEMQRRMGSAK